MNNLFDKAKANPVVKSSPKAKLDETPALTKNLESYAFVDALGKQLDSLKETMKPGLNKQMFDAFFKNRGKNYKGQEKTATASLELRKRASTSGLEEMEIELLETNGISVQHIEGDFKFNPQYMSDPKIMKKISDAFQKAGLPDDIIQFDASKARTITTPDSITELFRLNDEDTIKALLPIVGVPAIKAKTSSKLSTILAEVTRLLTTVDTSQDDGSNLTELLRKSLKSKH